MQLDFPTSDGTGRITATFKPDLPPEKVHELNQQVAKSAEKARAAIAAILVRFASECHRHLTLEA